MKFVYGVTEEHDEMTTWKNEKKNVINTDTVHVDEN